MARQFLTFAKILGLIRIAEHNGWVFICIVAAFAALTFMLVTIQRSSVKEFLLEPFVDSSNNFINWIITSSVFIVMLSVMLSQFVPIVPEVIAKLNFFGIGFSRFGATLLVISLFYLLKCVLSYLFYASTGSTRRWSELVFSATRIYFVAIFFIIALCFANYFYPIERTISISLLIGLCLTITLLKILLYIFSPREILPEKWYNKLLYICTLQIAPLFALWKFLFL